jgi:hypothetical protein
MGKSSPPPAPDYQAAAKETAEGNLQMADYQTRANRVNQKTPWGSLSYNYTPQYDSEGKETGSGWEQVETLTPQAQETLNKQMALSNQYADVAGKGFESARASLENPMLDTSPLPDRAMNVGQTAQDAIMSRLRPQLDQEDEALRARLANQGIGLGSEAYGREQSLTGQRRNDLMMQAALQGINLDQSNRASALQEQAYLQDRPLNLINALRTGSQVQNPQFQQFAQQQYTPGPDMLGATNAQYQAEVSRANAKNAQGAGLFGGILGVGMGLAGLPGAGGSMIRGARGLFG